MAIACWRALAGVLLLAVLPAVAAPSVAARIDGAPLYDFSVDTVWRVAQASEPQVARQAVLERMIGDRLLAASARARYGPEILSSAARVAFAREVTFDDQLIGTLRSVHGPQMERDLARLAGGIDSLLRVQPRPDAATLDALAGKPGALRLDSSMSAAQLEAARKLVLLRYAMPEGGAEGAITLADVYQRQNVQGRVAILARDVDFMQQQAKLQVGAQYVLHWSARRFGAAAVADLRAALAEQADAQVLLRMHGVGDDPHADSVLLDQLAGAVSKREVLDYYQRHREQFIRIERVRARHIRVPDEAAATRVAALLAGGADFAATARSHSSAPDAAGGGSLGWVKHEGTPGWLAQLVFSSEPGVAPPVRAPVGPEAQADWEIILVAQRVQGYQAAGSEAVRYAASRAIAREKARAQLAALQRQLREAARIEVMRAPAVAS